ncbi:MAG TPA: hypothetical protein VIH63_08525 [Xanthobacteraceae bacterium]
MANPMPVTYPMAAVTRTSIAARPKCKRLDNVNGLDEVKPKQKVDGRLRDGKRQRPKQMPAPEQGAQHKTGFMARSS